MPLSINTPLVRADIDTIISLKAYKVFLLNGFANDKLVIKGDPTPVSHVKTTTSIMKMVSPGAKMKLLTQQERNELIQFVEFFKDLKAFYQQTGVQAPELEDDRPIRELNVNLRDQTVNFMKMDHHQLTDIESAFEARSTGDKSPLKVIKRGLKAPGGLEHLGEIIAADMFIGNRDRFAPWMTPDQFGFGTLMITLKAVLNPGNVFLALTPNNMFKPIGLDYLDPYNFFKEMDRTLVDVEQEKVKLWPGRAIAEREHRKKFAKNIIRDLELLLSPHHKNFLTTKLGFDSQQRLERGMKQGCRTIAALVLAKHGNNMPISLRDRYNLYNAV